MKIRTNKKHENNDNKAINKKLKEEIMSVVITKLLNQIQNLYKKYEKLKKENSLLKNDLIYILKRILLNKNDYINMIDNNNPGKKINYQKANYYSINSLKNTSYLNSKTYNSFLSTEKFCNERNNYNQLYHNRNNNSINNKQIEKRRYSIDDDCKKGNLSSSSHLENSLQFNIQNKIDYYLNSLYKHNFSEECISGTTSIHLLNNKNQNIYDELFSSKSKNNKNKRLSHMNTDANFRKVSLQKNKLDYNSDDNNDLSCNNKYNISENGAIKNKNTNYLKVRKKEKNNNMKYNLKTECYRKKNSGSQSSSKINNNSNTKNTKYMSIHLNNRSRFLINKF
jgi:hypothetical protein